MEHYWKPLVWESNVTISLVACFEVQATNLLSISYTDYHNVKTIYKS